jgi:hypothetical protein
MLEREEAEGDGVVVGEGEMIAAAAVGKWESRGVGGISKGSGKPDFGFPRNGFSIARWSDNGFKMRGPCRPVTSISSVK